MKVKRDTLLLLACLVWGAAGFNILRIGLAVYPAFRTALNFCLSALVFAVFQRFVFGPLVKKHTARIRAYEDERHFFLKFFDKKAFAVMAVMMTGGIALRAGGLAPERFIAVFYTGLGASLLQAGALFGRNYGAALSRRRLRPGGAARPAVHDASEPVAERRRAPLLGHLPQHPLRPAGPCDHCAVLFQRQRAQ